MFRKGLPDFPRRNAAFSRLEPRGRAELLRHRCFVTCAKPHDDRWPYGLRLVEDGG